MLIQLTLCVTKNEPRLYKIHNNSHESQNLFLTAPVFVYKTKKEVGARVERLQRELAELNNLQNFTTFCSNVQISLIS